MGLSVSWLGREEREEVWEGEVRAVFDVFSGVELRSERGLRLGRRIFIIATGGFPYRNICGGTK